MQRTVFTTPVPAELKDAESLSSVPSERRLNKSEGVPLSPSEERVTEAIDVHGRKIR
ncbi:hypothetical protein [Neorhodopirellula lusitana]|uniref:hypothetical protein n=1 Tax=Neorhodopirellula lusitana TaxID=445327 RepID=UPI00384D2905